jgi:hypothetical protein
LLTSEPVRAMRADKPPAGRRADKAPQAPC